MKVGIERVRRSLVVPLVLLTGAFLAVPATLYSILEQAYQSQQELLIQSVEAQARIAAIAMRPALNGDGLSALAASTREASRLSGGSANVQLLFRPDGTSAPLGFYLSAAAASDSNAAGRPQPSTSSALRAD